jgi:nucleotide-binding universal stress UspA family protein
MRFSKILIPVDFTINTEVAIRKGMALCDSSDSSIHLLHVLAKKGSSKNQLEVLKKLITNTRPDIFVDVWIEEKRSIESSIIKNAVKINADLIVIGKNSHHSFFPFLNTVFPARVAQKTGITVLTVKPGAKDHTIKTVVVPVGEQFRNNKVDVINALRKKFPINICLVTFLEGDEKVIPASLLNAYRQLKAIPAMNITYQVLAGRNKMKAILSYCEKVNADLLIVNAVSETRVGWLNQHISDVLPVGSKTQILAV